MNQKDIDRFWSKVDIGIDDECWVWLKAKDRDGYGRFFVNTKMVGAHRFSYEIKYGPIPAHLNIDHRCRNRPCVNWRHLQTLSKRESDGNTTHKLKTHCPQGHPYVGENLYLYTSKEGHKERGCKTCRRHSNWRWEKRHV